MQQDKLIGAFYKSIAGEIVQLVDFAKDAETDSNLVLYKDMSGQTWAMKQQEFFKQVVYKGKLVWQFELVSNTKTAEVILFEKVKRYIERCDDYLRKAFKG